MNICVERGGFVNVRDGGYHLGTVCRDAARDGEVRPVEVLFDSDAKPQKTGLTIRRVNAKWEPDSDVTHDANQNPNQRDRQSHLWHLGAVALSVTLRSMDRRRSRGAFDVVRLLAGRVVGIASPDKCPKSTG